MQRYVVYLLIVQSGEEIIDIFLWPFLSLLCKAYNIVYYFLRVKFDFRTFYYNPC